MPNLATALAVASLVLGVIGFSGIYFGILVGLKESIAKLEADNATFWRVIGPAMAGIIHSPIHVRRDFLVDELLATRLTEPELKELRGHLDEMLDCAVAENDVPKQLAGAFLVALQEQQLAAKQRKRGKL